MRTARANGINIYYEEHGSGEPLLLIMGWAGNAATWQPQLPGLAKHFRVITFDNRGAGRSDTPQGPYTIREMAADTLGLMDALDVERAHVFGVSMGGMIAQELALGHPERLGSLVLGCTTAGGSAAAGIQQLRAEIGDFQATHSDGLPDLTWFAQFMKRLWTDEALAGSSSQLQDFVLSMIRFPPTSEGLHQQAAAVASHDAFDRLASLDRAVLVLTGTEDALIDPLNSMILADRVPGAELRSFAGLRHAFHLEEPGIVNSVIVDFIQRQRSIAGDRAPRAGKGSEPRKH